MGNYENIVKTEKIRKKVEEGDLSSAQDILDTIDLKKVKNLSDLNLFAEVSMENERYDESAELYMRIYEKYKSRKTIAQMVNISIKQGNVTEAEDYLEEYQKISPEDFDSYIFHYKIDKMKGASYEQLIMSLEALNQIEYTEKWAYELAKVYYKADMQEECIEKCSDIVLWFGEGTYVEKAKILRSYFTGETDKNKILEEIKRRSEGIKEDSESQKDTISDDVQKDYRNNIEEKISVSTDFMTENGMEELTDGLMQDVQNIMSSMPEEEQSEYSTIDREEEHYKYADAERNVEYREHSETESEEEQSQYVAAENETNPQLQEDNNQIPAENREEEKVKLLDISNELQMNLEEIWKDYFQYDSIKKQLLNSLEVILQENIRPVYMIITGTKGSGKITLAKEMALVLNKAGKIQSSKIAKISADKLNKVDINTKKDLLKSCCLVIGDASQLKRETIESLLKLAKSLQDDIAVILEEEEENIEKLIKEYPDIMNVFTLKIDLFL